MSLLAYTQNLGARLPRLRRPRVGWIVVPTALLAVLVFLATTVFLPVEAGNVPARQWRGLQEGGAQGQVQVMRSNEQWQAQWRSLGREAPATLDVQRQIAVFVGLGNRSSAGYSARLVSTTAHDERLFVVWEEVEPAPGQMSAQVVTQPWLFVVVNRGDLAPVIEQRVR